MKPLALLLPVLALSAVTAAHAQDLPEGTGKDVVNDICTSCHGADAITGIRSNRDGWQSIVDSMVSRGATATPEQIKTMVDYLTKNFGRTNVNKASSADMQKGLEITPAEADAIVAYRKEKGDFKKFEDLAKVPGLDTTKLTSKKDWIGYAD